MDLSTTYLGMKLEHPLMPGASPLVDDMDQIRKLEDAGAAAIVLHSLFEEQLHDEEFAAFHSMDGSTHSHVEAHSYFPETDVFALGPDEYLEKVRSIKDAVSCPVIASLNGATSGGWLEYAGLIQDAGADALELNVYHLPVDPEESGADVEARVIDIARRVREAIRIPIAVKLSPFFSSIPNLSRRLSDVGVDGLVLFNRFYEPDIDAERLEVSPILHLSDSSELLLRLRWLAILSGRIDASLALSGGVHSPPDVVKGVMAGAHAVQVVSALLRGGAQTLAILREGLREWLDTHEYESLAQAQGSMGIDRCPDPHAYTRGNYIKILQSWRVH